MNKPVYLRLSILELNKILVYEIWDGYVKPKYDEKVKLYYMDTDSFIVYIKTYDIYEDIAEDIQTRFETSIINQISHCLKKKKKKERKRKRKITWINKMKQVKKS